MQVFVDQVMDLPGVQRTAVDGRAPVAGQQLSVGRQGITDPPDHFCQIGTVEVVADFAKYNQVEFSSGQSPGRRF